LNLPFLIYFEKQFQRASDDFAVQDLKDFSVFPCPGKTGECGWYAVAGVSLQKLPLTITQSEVSNIKHSAVAWVRSVSESPCSLSRSFQDTLQDLRSLAQESKLPFEAYVSLFLKPHSDLSREEAILCQMSMPWLKAAAIALNLPECGIFCHVEGIRHDGFSCVIPGNESHHFFNTECPRAFVSMKSNCFLLHNGVNHYSLLHAPDFPHSFPYMPSNDTHYDSDDDHDDMHTARPAESSAASPPSSRLSPLSVPTSSISSPSVPDASRNLDEPNGSQPHPSDSQSSISDHDDNANSVFVSDEQRIEDIIKDLATAKRLISMKKLELSAQKAILTALREVLIELRKAIKSNDEPGIADCFIWFIKLAQRLLRQPSRRRRHYYNAKSGHGKVRFLEIQRALDDFRNRQSAASPGPGSSVNTSTSSNLMDAFDMDLGDPFDPTNPTAASTDDHQDRKTANAVKNLVSSKFLSRAMRRIYRGPTMIPDERLMDQLQQLHPGPSPITDHNPDLDIPSLEATLKGTKPKVAIIRDIFKDCLLKQNNGSSPGPSQISGELMVLLANDSIALDCLCEFAELAFNNTMPRIPREIILASTLIAPLKSNGKPRPIAMGEVLSKAFGDYASRLLTPNISDSLNGIQKSIGVSSGVEITLSSIQMAIEAGQMADCPANERLVVLKVDIKNAFNEICRRQVIRTAAENPNYDEVANFVMFIFGIDSTLLVKSGGSVVALIKSLTGTRQGDPFSNLIFCGTIHPALVDTQTRFPVVSLEAIADDIHLTGPSSEVFAAYDHLAQILFQTLHLQISEKSRLLWPYTSSPPMECVHFCVSRKLQLAIGAMETLGGVVGLEYSIDPNNLSAVEDIRQQFPHLPVSCESPISIVEGLWTPHFEAIDKLTSLSIPLQHYLLLLRTCVIAGPTFLTRVIYPSLTRAIIPRYQQKLLQSLSSRLKIPISALMNQRVYTQLSLPLSLGGLGFAILDSHYPLNFVSCFAYCVQWCRDKMGPNLPMFQEVQSSLDKVFGDMGFSSDTCLRLSKILPRQFPQLVQSVIEGGINPKDKLQHRLTRELQRDRFQGLVDHPDTTPQDRIRFAGITSYRASAWLTTIPAHAHLSLSDLAIQTQTRFWLGLAPSNEPPDSCPHCHVSCSHDPWHKLSCQADFKFLVNRRHNAVRDIIKRTCQLHDVGCEAEPVVYSANPSSGNKEARPDLLFHMTRPILADIEVIHSNAASYQKYSNDPSRILSLAQQAKEKKHQVKSAEINCDFVPIICSTYGQFHSSAISLFKDLGRYAENIAVDNTVLIDGLSIADSFVDQLVQSLATLIVKTNLCLVLGSSSHRGRDPSRFQSWKPYSPYT
jgi:hypothetical protein